MIYLDHNATTPIAPGVAAAMKPYIETQFGNPSNSYDLGLTAREAVSDARYHVAALLGAKPSEIVFTSGGTESNNMVLKGVFHRSEKPVHIITARIEHPAIVNPALFLMTLGADVTFLHSDNFGVIDPDDVKKAIRPETRLISIMQANNETGVIQPIADIADIAREAGVPLHTDAAQAVGKIDVDVRTSGVDFLTVAGHKLYAPKGVGALFIRDGLEIEPLLHGAAQESGRRGGTENVMLAAGLGEACRTALGRWERDAERLRRLRDLLYDRIKSELKDAVLIGHPEKRLPNTLNICFPGVHGEDILAGAPEIRASTGSACHAGVVKISPVLKAMGIPDDIAQGAVRLSLGRSNTEEQIERASDALVRSVRRLKS